MNWKTRQGLIAATCTLCSYRKGKCVRPYVELDAPAATPTAATPPPTPVAPKPKTKRAKAPAKASKAKSQKSKTRPPCKSVIFASQYLTDAGSIAVDEASHAGDAPVEVEQPAESTKAKSRKGKGRATGKSYAIAASVVY